MANMQNMNKDTALAQECADYATSLRSTINVVKLEGRKPPISFLRAAELFERAAARIAELEALAAGYAAARLEIESLHAQFEAVGAAPWQPIATAPKDGSEILLRSNRGRIANGMWSAANERSGFWAWAYVNQEPVEWMPLPLPAVQMGLTEETFCDLQFAAEVLTAIAERNRQVGDVIEPISNIRLAAQLAKTAKARIDRAVLALGPAFDSALASREQAPAGAAQALDAQELRTVARAIWEVMREYEDRCDLELEDIGCSHVVWQLANAAIAAQQGAKP